MDLEDNITVAKIEIDGVRSYLMVDWHVDSFEMYLFIKDQLWKGQCSTHRLLGFCKTLQLTDKSYYTMVKKCLSHQRPDYVYQLNSSFFYWKRKVNDKDVVVGFVPMERSVSPPDVHLYLLEIVISINRRIKQNKYSLKRNLDIVTAEYDKCLRDTEQFFSLKIDMEKTLCDKFLNLVNVNKSKVDKWKLRTSRALDGSDSQTSLTEIEQKVDS